MAFNIALSGLNAASKDLEVTANNIANTGGMTGADGAYLDVDGFGGVLLSQVARVN